MVLVLNMWLAWPQYIITNIFLTDSYHHTAICPRITKHYQFALEFKIP